ncbi:MAG: MFS transporter [Chloroflexota bacterium]
MSRSDTAEVTTKPVAIPQMDRRALALLSISHLTDDMGVGALPVMIPYFIAAHNLTYAAAAGLGTALMISSSVAQPILGQLSDRRPSPWLIPVGMLGAAIGLALAALLQTYELIWLSFALCGLGLAAFHPEAARLASYVAGPRRATGMSLFSLGGNVGVAIGPLLATPLLLVFGLPGVAFMAVPTVVMALVLVRMTRGRGAIMPGGVRSGRAVQLAGRDAWGPFARLTAVVMLRSVVFSGFQTFLALYWVSVLRQDTTAGGVAVSLLTICGAVGTLLGGWMADRYGRKQVLILSLALSSPLLGAFLLLTDPTLAMAMLLPLGLALYLSFSVSVVMGQEYLPNQIGTASGVTMGLAMSVGGLTSPLLGYVADQSGLPTALMVTAFVPLIAVAIAATLPTRGSGLAR